MNKAEMEEYWKTLCSFKGDNLEEEIGELMKKIRYPKYLYRYRAVNNNNLEALRTNKLYFSKASNYDDPFDTFLHININEIYDDIKKITDSPELLKKFIKEAKIFLTEQNLLPKEIVEKKFAIEEIKRITAKGNVNVLVNEVLNLRTKIQNEIFSICFSENGLNESLWLKYADMYKGFCLIYDLTNTENNHCGKMDKCKNCGIYKFGTRIYPIYYSNEPYDATNFAKYIMWQYLQEKFGLNLPNFIKNKMNHQIWEPERNSLIKKECHKYDEEWRMIANCRLSSPAMIECVPYGVIIGLRTPNIEKNLILALLKEAGIKNKYQLFINEKNELDLYLINEDKQDSE